MNKKMGLRKTAAHEVWRSKTSRGEQLLRRNWEVTVMCISWRRYARILTNWKTFIVQRSYAAAATVTLFRPSAS